MSVIPDISLVVPLFNEEGCLKQNTHTIMTHLDSLTLDYEIILVDDGSLDRTREIAQQITREYSRTKFVHIPVNRGKGHAVKTGVLNASGKYVLYTDADLAVPIHFIGDFLALLEEGFPLVLGSRHLPGSCLKVREAPLRQFLGEIFRRLTKLGLGLTASDITCGLKGFQKDAAHRIFSLSKIQRWGYDAEILFLARQLGYGVAEVPVEWYHSFDSKVRVASASVGTLIEMLKIRYYHLTNDYKTLSTPTQNPFVEKALERQNR